MRTSHESTVGWTGTPIYDALYAEYRRLFRALPGDRSGEEDLKFTAFQQWDTEAIPRQQGRHRGPRPALPPGAQQTNRMRDL